MSVEYLNNCLVKFILRENSLVKDDIIVELHCSSFDVSYFFLIIRQWRQWHYAATMFGTCTLFITVAHLH